MKQGRKLNVDMMPVLGIVGLVLVILYFLLSNINPGGAGKPPGDDRYYLFTRLYKNLGYRLIEHYPRRLSKHNGDLMICFDYQDNPRELRKLMDEWVEKGGTLWIAGFEGEKDPVGKMTPEQSKLKTVYGGVFSPEAGPAQGRPVVSLKGNSTRHFAKDSGLKPESIILYAREGPLFYRKSQGDGSVWVLSDSVLLANDFLKQKKAALFFNRLLQPFFGKRIYMVRSDLLSSRNSQKTKSILALLFTDRLLYITLQLLWILALFMARQGKRFGEPELVNPYARRTLNEHLKAIGHFYQKAGHAGIVDEINGEYFKYMLAKLTGLQWKDAHGPGEAERIASHPAIQSAGLTREQILEALKKDPRITPHKLMAKARMQERILKELKDRK